MLDGGGLVNPSAVNPSVSKAERLRQTGENIARIMKASASGPLRIAEEAVKIEEEWDSYKDVAPKGKNGKPISANSWLRKITGRNLEYHRNSQNAVEILSDKTGDIKRWMDRESAVWCARNIPSCDWPVVKAALIKDRNRNNGNCPNQARTREIAERVLGRRLAGHRYCNKCVGMRAFIIKVTPTLLAAGVTVPEF